MIGQVIGANLERLIRDRGISDSELATSAGCSRAYISNLTNGKVDDPSISLVIAFANALGITLETLLAGSVTEPRLPMPSIYLRKYGIANPKTVAMIDRLLTAIGGEEAATKLGQEGNEGKRKGKSERPRPSLASAIGKLFFTDQVASDLGLGAEGIGVIEEENRDISRIIALWVKMSEEQKHLFLALAGQMIKPPTL